MAALRQIMTEAPAFDLLVIGAGSAGLSAASFAARLRARVGLIEADRVGGDCTWHGCIPSKTLIELARRSRDAAIDGSPRLALDAAAIRTHVRGTIDRVYQYERPDVLESQGIHLFTGAAEFVNGTTVQVGEQKLTGRRYVVATGAEPLTPHVEGLAETRHWTYRTIFDLEQLPSRLIVLGGGPIGLELGQAFARLGTRVTIVEQHRRILSMADPAASAVLEQALREEGLDIRSGSPVERVWEGGGQVHVRAGGETVCGDAILSAFGRRPDLRPLRLDRAGIALEDDRLVLNRYLQTSQRGIYAAGDVAGSYQFTHVAAWQGFVAARNALLPGRMPGLGPAVPWVVFTDPEIAQVGLAEHEARQRHSKVAVHTWPMDRVDRAQTVGQTRGFLKVICRADDSVVGATLVGFGAGELINELSLAVQRKLSLADIAATIHAYPTAGFGLQQLSAEVTLRRLTSGWKGQLVRWLARRS